MPRSSSGPERLLRFSPQGRDRAGPTCDTARMYLQDPPDDAAVTAVYAAAEADAGYLMNYVRGWAWRPDVAAAFSSARSALAAETALGARDIAVINAVVARARENAYCGTAWGSKLADQTSPEVAAAVLRGGDDALDERGRALARFAELIARDPNAVGEAEIERLRAVGLDDRQIAEAAMLAAFRLAFMAFNTALGAATDPELLQASPPAVRDAAGFGRPQPAG
jgi:uncharacterized peroxidase-related enzyme